MLENLSGTAVGQTSLISYYSVQIHLIFYLHLF